MILNSSQKLTDKRLDFVRDGMNLVSYEFLASQEANNPGVLMLSEFAGSAESLSESSIIINPFEIQNTALAIKQVDCYINILRCCAGD